MKRLQIMFALIIIAAMPPSLTARAEDMRTTQIKAQKARQTLLQKALTEQQAAKDEAAANRQRILSDRSALKATIAELRKQNKALDDSVQLLNDENKKLVQIEADLTRQLNDMDSTIRELVGVIRINAKDMSALIHQNLQTALTPQRGSFLKDIADQSQFPGMAAIQRITDLIFDQTRANSEVRLEDGSIVDRQGNEIQAQILVLGPFTAAYRTAQETGFLNYSETSHRLFALSKLPPGHMQKDLARYMDGKAQAVPMDISRGGALRQLTHQLSLFDQIPKGGALVWPIIFILALGLVLICERIFYLLRKRFNADSLLNHISQLATQQQWEACTQMCNKFNTKPVSRVIQAGLAHRQLGRAEMENALQEAILKEIPGLERFLSTLGMLAVIAPLLGLLGTVTGMIDTFHTITYFGTGDARMMSGGISEALVTTMLGLTVAIPIMFAHTLLHRAVDNTIAQMEEKAVTFVNMVEKTRTNACLQ